MRGAIAVASAWAALVLWPGGSEAAPLCNWQSCTKGYCGTDGACGALGTCFLHQSYWCATGEPSGNPTCAATNTWGMCAASCVDREPFDDCDPAHCTVGMGGPEVCRNRRDENYSGCADEGCTVGFAPCTCVASCAKNVCSPVPVATCDPFRGGQEICANEKDDNCNGQVDEGCSCKSPSAGGKEEEAACCHVAAGADPILLGNGSAVTEPFTDFEVESVVRLGVTRTYTSADGSLRGEPHGIFGPGWHHEWEGELSCAGGVCTVSQGIAKGQRFAFAQAALSLDGAETVEVWRPYQDEVTAPDGFDVLLRQGDGTWVLHLDNGRELHFATVCDACGEGEPFCQDPLAGGVARLVRVVDERGNPTLLGYARPSGVLLSVSDDLGHALELRAEDACSAGLAREARYGGATVATWQYGASLELLEARDGQGGLLRRYVYEPLAGGYLQAVLDEAGAAVVEFSYDGQGRAIGVHDTSSSVGVSYQAGAAQVTEWFGGASSTSTRTLDQDGRVTSISEGCACGPAKTIGWVDRRPVCQEDALGHITYQEYDQLGRVVRRVEYKRGTYSCPPTATPSGTIRQEWRDYGVLKPVAQGVSLELDRVLSVSRKSTLVGSDYFSESYDHDPAPNAAIDPAGYACQEAPLPAGAVVCRQIQGGYVTNASGTKVRQRYATFHSYDGRGRLVRTVGPVNLDSPWPGEVTPVEERTYWGDGESLDRRGRLREVRAYPSPAAAPLVTGYDHDAFGTYRVTAPDGGVTTILKDARGRPTFVVGPDLARRETRYHDGMKPRIEIAPSGRAVRYGYDARGRVEKVELFDRDPEAAGATPVLAWSERRTHDTAGNVTLVERRDAGGSVVSKEERRFDVQHRVVEEIHPEIPGASRTFAYDASGFLAGTADEEGRGASFTPDALNRVSKVRRTGFDGQGLPVGLDVATYGYQAQVDSLASVVDAKTRATSYRHDDFGQVEYVQHITMKEPFNYFRDARGNVVKRTGGKVTLEQAYDGLDRVVATTAVNSIDGASVSYAYRYDEGGEAGRLTSVVEPERTVRFGYDAAGRLASETVEENGIAAPLVTTYAYDLDGDLVEVGYPSGLRVAYDLDPATKEAVRVRDVAGGAPFADQVTRLPGGPVTSLSFGNGLSLAQGFDLRHQPLSVASGPLQLGYTMSPAGDVAGIQEGETPRTFQYDFLDRLVSSPEWLRYAYDGTGNRTSETVEGARASYAFYNGAYSDRMTTRLVPGASGNVKTHAFGHDYLTNVTAIGLYNAAGTSVAKAVCLRRDPLGRLVVVGDANPGYVSPDTAACTKDSPYLRSVFARFKYDFRGRRVARWLASTGTWTYFVHEPDGSLLAEVARTSDPASPWAAVRDYVWLDGRPLAQVERSGGAADRYYYHLDHIGLPRALTNAAGQVVWSATPARPYGDLVETVTPDPLTGRTVVTNLRLPGQYDERLLSSVGLQGPYYNWNRWYLPGVGRYLELDPIAVGGGFNSSYGVDWYGYGGANPLRFIDWDALRIYTDYGQDPDRFGSPTCTGLDGATCSKIDWSVKPCTCRDGGYGFDAYVTVRVHREFTDKDVVDRQSKGDPLGFTLGQHEDRHVGDYRDAYSPGLDHLYKSEGFASMAVCREKQKGFIRWLKKYMKDVDQGTRRRDNY